jgi:hypothetical protein
MDTGKIFLGFALIAFSVAMVVNPASAAGCDYSCPVGSGDNYIADCTSDAGLLQVLDYPAYSHTPVINRISPGNIP